MSARASVTSQVVPQPLILASTPVQRHNPERTLNKRDSGIGIGTGTPSHRLSASSSKFGVGRPISDPESMAPTYRLYPNQSPDGRRDSRISGSRPHSSASASRARGLSSTGSSRVNSIDNALNMDDTQIEDFQSRYNARRAYTQSDGTIHQTKSIHSLESNNGASEFHDADDGARQPAIPAEFGRSSIHIPTRTSSNNNRRLPQYQQQQPYVLQARMSSPPSPEPEEVYEPGARSSAGSVFSQETSATSIHTLPPLQSKGLDNGDIGYLEPVIEDDPRSWDLVVPANDHEEIGVYALEKRAEQLFGAEHLRIIFEDPKLLLRFTGFLNSHRPKRIPILIYYLDALKALRAINYANAIAEALEPIKGQEYTAAAANATKNNALEEKASLAFQALIQDDLPAFIAHVWIQVVSQSIQRRITGTLAPHLREASEGLAEVFCLTDPSRTDNPIVFVSEEFTRTTQYGMSYVIGRNCRFLQGPKTSEHSVRRMAMACAEGKELTEVFVNYRRDGSPFMNLLMIAPLMDSRGNIRYYIGAQADVSGLLKDCSEMDGLARIIEREKEQDESGGEDDASRKDEFQELSEMFNGAELDTVRKHGGRMHKEYVDESDRESLYGKPRLLLKDPSQDILDKERRSVPSVTSASIREKINGKLEGVYQHYLLVRPAPSLRILFTSPSLRLPGILQSPFLSRIGGSARVRTDLKAALSEGRGVTAKIRWLTRPEEDGEGEGRPRWIHCTPLLGHSGAVGVWMIVLVDDESTTSSGSSGRRFRQAPPVANNIGGKEWDASYAANNSNNANGSNANANAGNGVAANNTRKQRNIYDKENERRGGSVEYFSPPASSSRNYNHMTGDVNQQNRPSSRPEVHHVPSADASEFSFNLRN